MARVRDRKAKILKTAAELFLDLGYDATSMNAVAQRAEVTKPGLYYHFKSKQELLFAIMSHAMDVIEEDLRQVTLKASSNEERLRRLLLNHVQMIAENEIGAFTLLVIDETTALTVADRRVIDQRKRSYFEAIRAILDELATEGRLRQVDTTVASFSLMGMVLWTSKWYRSKGRLTGAQVAHSIADLALTSVLENGAQMALPTPWVARQ